MSRAEGWVIDVGAGGWVRCLYPDPDRGVSLYLRLQPSDRDRERLSTYEVVWQSDKPVSVHAWSQVPFAKIEAAVNSDPRARELICSEQDADGPEVHDFEHYFAMELPGEAVRIRLDEQQPTPVASGEEPPPLAKPDRLTDEFLRGVAARYQWLTAVGELPGPGIAGAAGVPVRTAQRWVYEARKRGFLPPGRPGRVG